MTYDLDCQSSRESYVHEPSTYKNLTLKVSRLKRQSGNKQMDRQTDARYRLLYPPG